MDIEITNRRRKDLLGREELELEIDHAGEATPSGAAVRKKLAAEEDLDPATVEIVRVVSSSGRAVSRGEVHVHDEPVMDEVPEPDGGESDDEGEEDEDDVEEEPGDESEGDSGSEDADEEEAPEEDEPEPEEPGESEDDASEADDADEGTDEEKEGDE